MSQFAPGPVKRNVSILCLALLRAKGPDAVRSDRADNTPAATAKHHRPTLRTVKTDKRKKGFQGNSFP
jgi:hypothetical protein